MGVVIVEEAIRGLEVGHGLEDAALEAAFPESSEEVLGGIEPGGRGWRTCRGRS
jgi:hypothetical protein